MAITVSDEDLFIIKTIFREKNIGTYNIAKKYKWKDLPTLFASDKIRGDFYDTKSSLINYRLKRMAKEGLAVLKINGVGGNRKTEVKLNANKVTYKEKYRLPDRVREVILILDKDNKWNIFEM